MDAAQALRDLTEISSQIEAAVIVSTDGTLLAATLADDAAARRLADAAVGLVGAAASVPHVPQGADGFVQLEVAMLEGCVFVVRDEERAAAAVTSIQPTAGLVFFDLKSCLRAAAAKDGDGKPRPRPRRTRVKVADAGDETPS